MKKIQKENLYSILEYETIRTEFGQSALVYRNIFRKVNLTDWVSLCFENSETVKYQLLETLYIDQVNEEDKIDSFCNAYNNLIPDSKMIISTLSIYKKESTPELKKLFYLGNVQDHVYIKIGNLAKIYASDLELTNIKVHEDNHAQNYFLKFVLSEKMISLLQKENTDFFVGIDHPLCAVDQRIHEDFRKMIAFDFDEKYM